MAPASIRRVLGALVVALVVGWGCGGEALPETLSICDGSDDLRLVYTTAGGFVPFEDEFTAKYGRSYLAIDGHCDYWLGQKSLQGLRVGTLDAERAASLSSELEFGRYSTVTGARGRPCSDSGVAYLRDVTGTLINIGCGAPTDAPRVWSAAFGRVQSLPSELEPEAQATWTNSSLLVIRDERTASDDDLEWTAALDLETLAIDYPQTAEPPDPAFSMDPATLEVVNGMRQHVLENEGNPFALFVRDREGRRYQLYVRDEPPPHVAAALEDVLATEW